MDGYIEPNHRYYVNTGTFLKTYGLGVDGYGERRGYDSIERGWVVVMVRDGKLTEVRKVRI